MITEISFKNFKSWQDTESVRLAPITGLFGSNSSGKTSFIQLLLMLKQTTESPDRAQVLNLGDDKSLVELGSFRDMIFNHSNEKVLSWSFSWNLKKSLKVTNPSNKNEILFEGQQLKFEAEIEENGGGRLAVNKLVYGFSEYNFEMKRKSRDRNQYKLTAESINNDDHFQFQRRAPGRAWDLPAPMKCYGFPDQVKAYFQNAEFLADFELEFEKLLSRVYYLGPLRDYPKRQYSWAGAQPADMGQRGEKVIDALLASRDRKEYISRGRGRKSLTLEGYVAWWLKELKLIHSFSVEPITDGSNLYQVWVKKTIDCAKVLITDVGFGVSQILPVLTLCYYVPEGSTILMEQPEIHLHPTVQAGLADVFIDAIKTRNVQIILESHSEHLLKRLQRRIAEEQLSTESAALYFCKMPKGKSELNTLDLDMFGNIINWPEGFFGDEFGEIAAMSKAIMERKKRGQG